MPMVVNQAGMVTCVRDKDMPRAIMDGCRVLGKEDMDWLQRGQDTFAIPHIAGLAEGAWGHDPVIVCGKGPSAPATTPHGWRRIVVNQSDFHADAVVALDSEFWKRCNRESLPPLRLAPRGIETFGIDHTAFSMPMQRETASPSGGRTIEIALGNMAVQQAHFSGIAAMLVALYLTNGPVVLAGIDLSGVDAAEVPYIRQERGWEAASKVVQRVFITPKMTGPLTGFFPVWRDQSDYTDKSEWVLIGGGPSADAARRRLQQRYLQVGTANAGIKVCGNPDLVWLSDAQAVKLMGERINFAAKHANTVVVPGDDMSHVERGWSFHGRSSGVMLLRSAIERGARDITLYGFDGYDTDSPWWSDGMNVAMCVALCGIILDNRESVRIRFADPKCRLAVMIADVLGDHWKRE